MSQESTSPPQAGPVTPHLVVDGAAAAIEFYKAAFGAVEVTRQAVPDSAKLIHASIMINGGLVYLVDDFPEMNGGKSSTPAALGGSPVTIHLTLPDVDATWAQAVAAGATVTMPLADQFWGDRFGMITDPFGHTWSLATPKRQPSEDEMKAAMQKEFAAPA